MLQLLKYSQKVIIEDVVPHPAFLITKYLISVELREGRWGDGEMGGQGDKGKNNYFTTFYSLPNAQCPITNYQLPMPHSQCPIPHPCNIRRVIQVMKVSFVLSKL